MKIATIADCHVGNHKNGILHGGPIKCGMNTRCRQVVTALERAVAFCKEQEVDALVVAGDTFDTARPPPQMVEAVQRILDEVPSIVLVGNHDRWSDAPGDHALGPLYPVANVIEEPRSVVLGEWELVLVPYMPGNAKDWFEDAVDAVLKKDLEKQRLLFFHLGVEDEHTSSFLRGAHDSIHRDVVEELMELHDITYAFAGNWHDHQHWPVLDGAGGIAQCGTLAPTGWDNEGDDGFGNVVLFDTEAKPPVTFHEIPGPRFLTVNGPRAIDTVIKHSRERGNDVFVQWRAPLERLREAQEEINEWVDAGLIVGGKAVIEDDQRAEEAAREAAKVTRKAETLGEALAKFVEAMPLQDGVDRGDVLEKAQSYLGGA